ncbi:hypothetical protein BGW80DRAFT_1463557 [Lactifluus volemus]|nr:hypothetical protein BGW80DRAFT_1463557 [Lactifluus volemus]
MTSTDPNALTQKVSSFNSSSVKYSGNWQRNNAPKSFSVSHPSSPASVVLQFYGTQAGVYGLMSSNNAPLKGSIASSSGSSSDFTGISGDTQSNPTLFFITDTLPFRALSTPKSRIRIARSSGNTSATVPTGPSGAVSASSSGLEHRPLRVGVIVGIVLSSMRRQRQRRSHYRLPPWLRLPRRHRNKLSPSAQYLASVAANRKRKDDGSIGGTSDAGLGYPSKAMFMSPSASTSKVSLLGGPSPSISGRGSLSVPWPDMMTTTIDKPLPPGPDGRVPGYPWSNYREGWISSQALEQESGVWGNAVPMPDGVSLKDHTRYNIRVLP